MGFLKYFNIALVGTLLSASQAFANCNPTATIKTALVKMFGSINTSDLKIAYNFSDYPAQTHTFNGVQKANYFVTFKTQDSTVSGLPVLGKTYIGGYNVSDDGCIETFLGASMAVDGNGL